MFRGVYMRNQLPAKVLVNECGVINLGSSQEDSTSKGTHWVAYYKKGSHKYYFDSFGDAPPPIELTKYLGNNISYNYNNFQKSGVICGHLCLVFLIYITNK